jgi:DNA polymerase III alpha subunit
MRLHVALGGYAKTPTSLDAAGTALRPNSEAYLKSGGRLFPLFRAYPDALANTLHIAERCQFVLQYGLQDLPAFPAPPGQNGPKVAKAEISAK